MAPRKRRAEDEDEQSARKLVSRAASSPQQVRSYLVLVASKQACMHVRFGRSRVADKNRRTAKTRDAAAGE
jgi:hypothetical protein